MFLLKSFSPKSFSPKSWDFGAPFPLKPSVEWWGGGGDIRKKKRKNDHASDYDFLNPLPRKIRREIAKETAAARPATKALTPAVELAESSPYVDELIKAIESNNRLWEEFYKTIPSTIDAEEIFNDSEDEELLLFLL